MRRHSRWILSFGALVAVVLYAVYQGGYLAWHLFGFVLMLVVVVFLSQAGPLSAIEVQRSVRPGPYHDGETLNVTLSVSSTRYWFWPNLSVIDHLPIRLGVSQPHFLLHQVGTRPVPVGYQIPSLKRGAYELDAVSLVTSDLFGFFRRSRRLSVPVQFVVWPATIPLAGTRLFSRIWHGENLSPQPTREESSHLRGIREYVPGDRLSHVHWKTSAHTGDFKVKQFEPETKPEFTVVLDSTRHFTPEDWEVAISVAASLIQYAHQNHEAIGLAAMDTPETGFGPAAGIGPLAAMMNFLSGLGYDPYGSPGFHPPRTGTRLVAVTSVSHQDAWRSTADIVIPVGPDAVKQLVDLPRALNPRLADVGGAR